MKIGKRWPLYLLLIVVGVLGTRLAWRLSLSETGWTPQLDKWVKVSSGLFGIEYWELGDKDPAEQATFWLGEVKRIGPADDDPEVAMGAAWMLDAPQPGFIRRHFRLKDGMDFPSLPTSWRRELDGDTIAAMTEEFERLCRQECLATIERAVRLDDANIELRRARALLLFHNRFMSLDLEPRQDDWLSVLDECADVDSGNALYNYLAALHLWTSSADYTWEEDGYVLNVADQGGYEEGNVRLAAGLEKPHLRFGTEGYAATFEFLEGTSVSRSDYLNVAGSRQIVNRATNLLYRIMRWASVQSDVEKRAGRFDEAAGAVRRVLAISEQVTEAGNYPGLLSPKLILRQWSLANLEDIQRHHANLLSAEEAGNVLNQLAEVQREVKIFEEVGRRMAARAGTSNAELSLGMTATVPRNFQVALLMSTAQLLVIVCGALALISSLISIFFSRNDDAVQVTPGWGRHTAAWLFAFGISFVLLGMFPAEIVSLSAQTWMVCGTIWVAFSSAIVGLLYLLRGRLQLSSGQMAALTIITSLPMIAVVHVRKIIVLAGSGAATLHPALSIGMILLLAMICWASFHFFRKFVKNPNLTRRRKLFAFEVVFLIALVAVPAGTALGMMTHEIETQPWISPAVWKEAQGLYVEAEELRNAMKVDESSWAWAFIQWQVHRGPVVAPLIALVIMIVWQLIRRAGQVEGGLRHILKSEKKKELRQSVKSLSGSCIVAALIFFALYLGTMPPVVDMMDTYHRVYYIRMAQPVQAWEEVAELSAEIRADKETLARLQAEIVERNRQIAVQEAWLDEDQ